MARALTRDPQRGIVGGVASGFGRYLDVDPVLVRIAFVALSFVNGLGILLYLICWVIVPKEGAAGAAPSGMESAFTEAQEAFRTMAQAGDGRSARLAIGYSLIGLGAVLLLHNLDWIRWPAWATLEVLWPLILVGMGAGLVLRSVHKERFTQPPPP